MTFNQDGFDMHSTILNERNKSICPLSGSWRRRPERELRVLRAALFGRPGVLGRPFFGFRDDGGIGSFPAAIGHSLAMP